MNTRNDLRLFKDHMEIQLRNRADLEFVFGLEERLK
jgi:hypothetical protein